jgi:hypothetical protein
LRLLLFDGGGGDRAGCCFNADVVVVVVVVVVLSNVLFRRLVVAVDGTWRNVLSFFVQLLLLLSNIVQSLDDIQHGQVDAKLFL